MDTVSRMWEGLDKVRNTTSNLPAKAYALKSYIDGIAEQTQMVKDDKYSPPQGAMAAFAGMPVYETNSLPKGVLCMFLDRDNNPVGQIVNEDYEPAKHPTNKSEDGK